MIAPPSDDNDIYLMNNPYHYPAPSRPSLGMHQPTPSSNHHHHPPPPRLANVTSAPSYDEYDYDSFSRKPMVKPPSHTTYPHSPPHEESSKYKPNPLSHTSTTPTSNSIATPTPTTNTISPSSHWSSSPSLTSQLPDGAKSGLAGRHHLHHPSSSPLYAAPNGNKDDLISPSQCIGRKRSLQSTTSSSSIASPPPSASSILPPPPSLMDDKRNIKRLRTLNN
ncbi:hypothetical protein BCR42DRAFT_30437 [Absidia repens]|uniref:Uncharacterized protein n=1 Tax=Absidia repens TaxID=90262 RepID=A0A1X2IJ29_9FUNG|nr:hypothetical protein BCR42DRAFT_30437 [Absidia repens]